MSKLRAVIDASFAQLVEQPSSLVGADYAKALKDLKRARTVIDTLAGYMRADTQEVQVKLMLTALDGALMPTSALLAGSAIETLKCAPLHTHTPTSICEKQRTLAFANTRMYRQASERDAKANLTQHFLAVNYSIKNVLQAAEMLKAKKYEVGTRTYTHKHTHTHMHTGTTFIRSLATHACNDAHKHRHSRPLAVRLSPRSGTCRWTGRTW